MATVLFIGGVGPDISQEDLATAFARHANLLASSVIRHPETGKCVGQAYVTVASEDVAKAVQVAEVGGNGVCVFPVEVESWVAPPALQAAAPDLLPHASQWGLTPPSASVPSTGWAPGGTVVHSGPSIAGLPTSQYVRLQAVLDQLHTYLAANPRATYNGKPFYMLLNETSQKKQMALQVSDVPEGSTFSCSIAVSRGANLVCNGRATGGSKKDAKHNAAACCLDALLAIGEVSNAEMMSAMMIPDGASGSESGSVVGAAASALAQTNNIMRLGLYPKCAEMMALVHSTDAGRVKTPLMVLNEYAVRARLTVHHDELQSQVGGTALAGPFVFQSRLLDFNGKVVAQAKGVEVKSKQEAKQAAAASLIEYILVNNIAAVDALARAK